ncbi:MAG: serine hydrolase [Gemmatimonadetes bacterium]|nr:serine hydrolase [Gemmatimonadota bacterium]
MRASRRLVPTLVAWTVVMAPGAGSVFAYPFDGLETLGIRRLAADAASSRQPAGARLRSDEITLHLLGPGHEWDLSDESRDPGLQKALEAVFRDRDPSYALAIVDYTDPEHVRWAGLREDRTQFPGSLGKVLTMAGLFDALARAFPDVDDRMRILRETNVPATTWAMGDDFHKVPIADPVQGTNHYRSIRKGDTFTLAEWIDHMVSASANSAGATVWREAMLLRRFGDAYPVSAEEADRFFAETPKTELTRFSLQVLEEPVVAAGLDPESLRQGTLWTKTAQARIPGVASLASPRELVRLLMRLEQGRIVDEWSSREMKRFLYMTRRRYRYAYAPELADAAVYFKSGSFYSCVPEEDFQCGKYRGNRKNQMNSAAIVESPAGNGPQQRRYAVALISDVLRKNSAWDHARIGAAIDEIVRTRNAVAVDERGTDKQMDEAGKGD